MTPARRILGERIQDVRANFRGAYRFRSELFKHWPTLTGAFLFSLAFAAVRLAEPWPLKFIFDNVLADMPLDTPSSWIDDTLGGDRTDILIAASVAILVLGLLRGVTAYYQKVMTSIVGQQVVLAMRQQLFAHMQRLSLSFHTRNPSGELLSRLTGDINQLRQSVVASMVAFFSNAVIVLGFLVIMFLMEWRLALLVVFVVPLLLLLMTVYSGLIRKATRRQRRQEGELAARLQEGLSGIHLVQMFAREDEEDERLRSMNQQSFKSGLKADRLGARMNRSVELVLGAATAGVLFFGATQVIAGRLTPGELIVFVAYMQGFYRPLRQLARTTQRASKAASSLERITDVLDQASEVPDGPDPAPAFRGEIRFGGVDFAYEPGAPVLRDVDLVVEAGQTVALVGPTGAGKSSLLALIPRLYDPSRGAVLIDGTDVRRFTLKSLRDQISVVPQEGMLFATSIRENIAYGKPDASDADIEAAARAALIHDFVQTLPQGYDTVLGERGVTLSGGQRQRLAIARAIVKDAPIVLLDEPTTGLDSSSEQLVMEALDRLQAGRTVLVIAHRLTTVRRAQVIFVVDGGRIVERGTHEELMAHGRDYRRLYDLQFSPGRHRDRPVSAPPKPAQAVPPRSRLRGLRRWLGRGGRALLGPAAPRAHTPIPLPPPDPALGGLGVALDGDAVAEILTRLLPDCASGELEVEASRPRYIRYKPGTNCLVQYDLTLRGEDGRRTQTLAHLRLYADRQAELVWMSRSFHRLVERAREMPGPPATRAALVPALKGLVEIYPVDRKMPGLVGAALLARDPSGRPLDRVELVRYKPGRKAVLRYQAEDGGTDVAYGRVHADGRGAALLEAGRALAAAGVPTPAPFYHDPELGLLFVEPAAGARLADLSGDEFDRWLPAVAEALAALHCAHVDGLPPLPKRNKEGAVLSAARTLATIRPGVAPLALRLGATLAARLAEATGAETPVHGDFYDDQVLVSDAGPVLLDFDATGCGNPLLDVGNFLAHLAVRRDERSRWLFLDAYADLRPEAIEDVPLFEAAALLRIGITPFRWLQPDWPQEVERRVELAAARLADDRGSRRFSFAPRDTKLPQLELLQEPAHAARELERVLREGPVEVVQATLVRHKPGRRCLLRYDVRVGVDGGSRAETFYGKAYASGRGAQVYERLRAVASAEACGPDVAIPEPLGYVAPMKLLVQRAVSGEPAGASLLAGDESLAVRIADALQALHASGVLLERRHGLDDELAPLPGRVERLAAADEALAAPARRCLELVRDRARLPWQWRWQPVHRDFYPDQVLGREDGLAVLDWDDAAMSEPAVDVANFLGHLRLLALQRTGTTEALESVAAAFLARYQQLDPDVNPALLRFLEGATLLRLADIHLPRPQGSLVAGRLLEESEALLRQ